MSGRRLWPTLVLAIAAGSLIMALVEVHGQDLAADTRALMAFRDAFDPRGTKLNWTNATSACTWNGVVCAGARVTQLRLPGEGLRGAVPPGTLSLLSELRVVSLRNNMLTGPFPGELGDCNHLHALYLGYNDFYGPVPNLTSFWPRLTHLSLEYNRFSGSIPESIGLFERLYLLNLRNNAFSGAIPPFDLENLTLLDVGANNLSGAVPVPLTKFGFGAFLGNPNLCGFPLDTPCPSSPTPEPAPEEGRHAKGVRLSWGAVIAIMVGAVALLILFMIGVYLCLRSRRSAWRAEEVKGKGVEWGGGGGGGEDTYSSAGAADPERTKLMFFEGGKRYSFDLEDLLRASAEVLGKGTAGTAYKAVLEDGIILAVKRLKDVTTSRRDFETQVHTIGTLQHRNVVPLRAFYFSKEEKLLVYDYMPRGSLAALLHGSRGAPVDWVSRVRVALGAARGLAYLHINRLVHGNIKSSNILLTPELDSCIADSGLAQLLTTPTRVAAYRAPEIADPARKPTQLSDVYSFGVVLLELLTGKAPAQVSDNQGVDLPRWVQSVVREEWTSEVFDVELMRYQNVEEEMVAMLQIAMQCVDAVPDRRPRMADVLPLLEDVHQFSSDTGDERRSESMPGSELDKDSFENTPSHAESSQINRPGS